MMVTIIGTRDNIQTGYKGFPVNPLFEAIIKIEKENGQVPFYDPACIDSATSIIKKTPESFTLIAENQHKSDYLLLSRHSTGEVFSSISSNAISKLLYYGDSVKLTASGGDTAVLKYNDLSSAADKIYIDGQSLLATVTCDRSGGILLITSKLLEQSLENLSKVLYAVAFPYKYFFVTDNPVLGKATKYTGSVDPVQGCYWLNHE